MLVEAIDLRILFDQANLLLANGEPRRALQIAQQAWSLAPEHADCANLIGVCAIALGDGQTAEQCWLHAIALCPEAVEAHFNLAMYYDDKLAVQEAQNAYLHVLALAPDHAQAHARLGVLLAGRQYHEKAEQHYRQALALNPGDAASHANLGVLLAGQQRDAEAEQSYRQALALNPGDAKTHSNLGVLLARLKRHDEAEQCYRQSIALDPASAEAHTNLGLLLELRKNLVDAERYQRIALQLDPQSSEIHSNLANLLGLMEKPAEAEQHYREALRLNPQSVITCSNLGVLLAYDGRETEAEDYFRRALSLNLHYQLARLNLAMLLLIQGRLDEGWHFFEARYHPDLPDPDTPIPTMPFPQWQGEDINGKSLLICPEQGLGDLIQFCRYVPLLKERGARWITLVCRPALVGVMNTLAGVDAVITIDDIATSTLIHDLWTLPMSLPLHFGTILSSIPTSIPYLHVLPEWCARWSSNLPHKDHKYRIGLVWKGNAMHANDGKRSLPGLHTYAPLWENIDACFFSLQYGARDSLPRLPAIPNLHEVGSGILDFADSAAILEQMDLLITVDTSFAHLAGALGKPCWVLLPAYRTDWRWLRNRQDSPWYPQQMRLFRQEKGQNWESVIALVGETLVDYID